MNGRYGTDSFFTFLMWAEVILILVNVFARNSIITLIEFAVIIYSLFRAFSKNTLKRRDENAKYLSLEKIDFMTERHTFTKSVRRAVRCFAFPKSPEIIRRHALSAGIILTFISDVFNIYVKEN